MNIKISLLALVLFSQCNQNSRDKSFDSFYIQFHQDSLYQMQHIEFPLPGLNTDDMDVDDTTLYLWKEQEWVLHRNLETNLFEVELIQSDTTVIEKLSSQDYPGWLIERRFEKIEGIWFLVYYENINL